MTTLVSDSKGGGKTYLVLSIYDALLNGKEISKTSFCYDNGVSPRTFDRYISEIRCFLTSERYDLELIYISKDSTYKIVKTSTM